MKIAIVIRQLRKTTGAARGALQRAALLTSLGHQVCVIAQEVDADRIRATGATLFKVRSLGLSGSWGRWNFEKQAEFYIARQNFDLVIAHGDIFKQDVLFIHNCVHLQSEWVDGRPLPATDTVGPRHEKLIRGGEYKVLVANSELMKRDLVKRFAVDPQKILVNYPGYDPEQFCITTESKTSLRQRLGLPEAKFLIGLVTSGEPKKRGVDLLIEAFQGLPDDIQAKAQLLIVGKNMQKKTAELMRDFDLSQIIFQEPRKDVESLFSALDLFVLPARLEEFGRSALEAAVLNVPVVVSDHVGAIEVLPESLRQAAFRSGDMVGLRERLRGAINEGPPSIGEKDLAALREKNSEAYRLNELLQAINSRGWSGLA